MTTSPYDSDSPVVGIVMGSDSDWSVMEAAATVLEEFGTPMKPMWFRHTACLKT